MAGQYRGFPAEFSGLTSNCHAAAHDRSPFLGQVGRGRIAPSACLAEGGVAKTRTKTEIELKLVGPAGDIAAVPGLEFLHRRAVSDGVWERLASTYYDSADGRLKAAGVSLRIREEGGGRKLSAKLAPKGEGPFRRIETDRDLSGDEHLSLTGAPEIDRHIGASCSDLAPVARTVLDRWTILVSKGGATIEVSAESGRVERLGENPATAPLAEIELELIEGDPASLFTLAARFIRHSGGRLRLATEAKLDRALRAGELRRPGKAPRPSAPDGASVGEVFAAAMKVIAPRIIETSAYAAATHDSDAARQLRAALRRFRALAKHFGKALGGARLAALADEARGYARIIGAARDLDIFIRRNAGLVDAPPSLTARLQAAQAEAWGDVERLLNGEKFALFALAALKAALAPAHLEGWREALNAPARQHTDEMLERSWKKLRRSAAKADFGAPASLHPLRKKLKMFRYAAQIYRGAGDAGEYGEIFRKMSKLQDALGEINDAVAANALAERFCEGADAAKAAGFIAGYRNAEASLLSAAAQDEWRAFIDAPPFWRDAGAPGAKVETGFVRKGAPE